MLLVLLACSPDRAEPGEIEVPGQPQDSSTDSPVDSEPPVDSDPLTAFDCATVPDEVGEAVMLEGPRGYNDVAFDGDGAMLGNDSTQMWKATSREEAGVWVPGTGMLYGLDWLPSGDLIGAREEGGLLRITPEGGSEVIAPDLRAYGVAVGQDGMVYTGSGQGVFRVDPDSGEINRLVARDFSVLYFGTQKESGEIYRLEISPDGVPVGEPEVVVDGTGGWHDSLSVDACGNIWITSWFGWKLGRVNADKSVTTLREWPFDDYGHGISWGASRSTWDELSIYMPHPYIGSVMSETYVGVPRRRFEGEVVGGSLL